MVTTAVTGTMAVTQSRTKQSPERLRRLSAWAVLAIAASLLAASVPRLVSGIISATAPGMHPSGTFPTAETAPDTLDFLRTAQGWSYSAKTAVYEAQTLRLLKDPGEVEALKTLLAASPQRSAQWLRLSRLALDVNTDTNANANDNANAGALAEALTYWRLSVLTARLDPVLMASRIDIGLRLLPTMTDDDRSLLRDQFRLTIVVRPDLMASVMLLPRNIGYWDLYERAVKALTQTDIDHMVRIHALH